VGVGNHKAEREVFRAGIAGHAREVMLHRDIGIGAKYSRGMLTLAGCDWLAAWAYQGATNAMARVKILASIRLVTLRRDQFRGCIAHSRYGLTIRIYA